jgi:hypothetical protein
MTAYVYSIVSKKTGARYVGATAHVEQRFREHANTVDKHTDGDAYRPYNGIFIGHTRADLRFEILEAFELAEGQTLKAAAIGECEAKWIRKLRPAGNSKLPKDVRGYEVVDLTNAA